MAAAVAVPTITSSQYRTVVMFIMDARSAMRPCYILLFFFNIFYARLSWPNG